MSRKRIKQYLMLLTVVGLIAVAANGSGTFASFTAQTENDGNTFATGSLLLSDTIGTDVCNSNDTSGANTTVCTTNIDLENAKPGTAKTGSITLQNTGTLDGTLTPTLGSCSDSVTNSLGFNASGDLCTDTLVSVEASDGTTTTCAYGVAASSGGGCSTDWTAYTGKTLADFLSTGLSDSTLAGATTTNGTDGGLVTYTISFYLPDGSSVNQDQDHNAKFDMTWHLAQS